MLFRSWVAPLNSSRTSVRGVRPNGASISVQMAFTDSCFGFGLKFVSSGEWLDGVADPLLRLHRQAPPAEARYTLPTIAGVT